MPRAVKPVASHTGPAAKASAKGAFSEQKLAAAIPARIGEWQRVRLGNPVPETEFDVRPVMQARYQRGTLHADVEMTDLGEAGIIAAQRAPLVAPGIRQTATGSELTYLVAGHLVREEQQTAARRGSAIVVLGNGLSVRVGGTGLDSAALQELVSGLDLAAAAKLERSAR